MFQFVLIRVDCFLGVDRTALTEDHHRVLFRYESAILSGTLDFFSEIHSNSE